MMSSGPHNRNQRRHALGRSCQDLYIYTWLAKQIGQRGGLDGRRAGETSATSEWRQGDGARDRADSARRALNRRRSCGPGVPRRRWFVTRSPGAVQAAFDGPDTYLGPAAQIESTQDALDMIRGRARRDHQALGDLVVRESLGDARRHFLLAPSQPGYVVEGGLSPAFESGEGLLIQSSVRRSGGREAHGCSGEVGQAGHDAGVFPVEVPLLGVGHDPNGPDDAVDRAQRDDQALDDRWGDGLEVGEEAAGIREEL